MAGWIKDDALALLGRWLETYQPDSEVNPELWDLWADTDALLAAVRDTQIGIECPTCGANYGDECHAYEPCEQEAGL